MSLKTENPKNTRVSLVMAETLRDDLKKVAYIQQKSFNAFCCDVLEQYLKKHTNDIRKYNETFEGENDK